MIYILDTADLAAIKHCNEFYPLAGVTTNPSLIAKEGKPGPVLTALYERLRAIQYGDVADPYGWVTVIE